MTKAIVVERSDNAKLGGFSTTYIGQNSCPGAGGCRKGETACPLYGAGCYAETGPCGLHLQRLSGTATEAARAEAVGIRQLSGKRPLRLHTVGDCRTDAIARTVAAAAAYYSAKHGQPVYTYTHSTNVARASFGSISVFRSCHSIRQVKQADRDGFAAALLVGDADVSPVAGYKLMVCPAQQRDTTCAKCRLCLNADKLRDRHLVICFTPHGTRQKRAATTAWFG